MCIMSFYPSPKEKCAHISFVCCYCFSVDDWVANVIFKVQKQEYKQILYFKCFPVYIFLFIFSRKYVYNMSYLKRNRSYRWDELWARLSWKDAAKNEKEEVIKLIEGKVLKRTQLGEVLFLSLFFIVFKKITILLVYIWFKCCVSSRCTKWFRYTYTYVLF